MKIRKNRFSHLVALILALAGLLSGISVTGSSFARPASRLTGNSHAAKLKNSPISHGAPASPALAKSLLIYGPSLDTFASPNEQSIASAAGYAVTVVDEATWVGMTTAQFAAFDAIVFGDPSCDNLGGVELLATADATKSVWSPAIKGPVYIQGTDPVWHGFSDDEPVAKAQTLISDGISFAASGPRTGVYVSLSCHYAGSLPDTRVDFLSLIGDFRVSDSECADAVTIVNPSHPAMAGLTDSDLSDWGCSTHEFVTGFPATFEVLATAIRPSDGASFPYIISSPRPTIPISDVATFVTQQYRDFLDREPDSDGQAFWTNEITECGTDPGCIEAKRINVSAAFFLSIEFQQTGYLVYRMYKASYGNMPGMPVPIRFDEFLPDTQQVGNGVIVNQTGWEQVLENNRQIFISEFVQRARFTSAYPASITPANFVDALFANAGVTPSLADRAAAIDEFAGAGTSADTAARARALRRIAENSTLAQQEFNKAFVLMQYFGYLRRNPNDAPEPTLDFQGYNFWLTKLNQFNGNFVEADMVKAFLVSGEYRSRFGQP